MSHRTVREPEDEELAELRRMKRQEVGRYRLQVETRRFASGVYFVRMHAGSFAKARQLTVVR